jgi:hypothetical protein
LKQAIITFAGVFGFALVVNWAVLTVFGQKSADRAEHSIVGILLLMAYVSFRAQTHTTPGRFLGIFFVALIPCYLGTVFPDVDITLLGIGGHRNPLFHSSLSFWLLVWVAGRPSVGLRIVVAGYGVGLVSHLWWDVFDYGDVRWLPGGAIDRLWLGVHGFLCLIPPGQRLLRTGSRTRRNSVRA